VPPSTGKGVPAAAGSVASPVPGDESMLDDASTKSNSGGSDAAAHSSGVTSPTLAGGKRGRKDEGQLMNEEELEDGEIPSPEVHSPPLGSALSPSSIPSTPTGECDATGSPSPKKQKSSNNASSGDLSGPPSPISSICSASSAPIRSAINKLSFTTPPRGTNTKSQTNPSSHSSGKSAPKEGSAVAAATAAAASSPLHSPSGDAASPKSGSDDTRVTAPNVSAKDAFNEQMQMVPYTQLVEKNKKLFAKNLELKNKLQLANGFYPKGDEDAKIVAETFALEKRFETNNQPRHREARQKQFKQFKENMKGEKAALAALQLSLRQRRARYLLFKRKIQHDRQQVAQKKADEAAAAVAAATETQRKKEEKKRNLRKQLRKLGDDDASFDPQTTTIEEEAPQLKSASHSSSTDDDDEDTDGSSLSEDEEDEDKYDSRDSGPRRFFDDEAEEATPEEELEEERRSGDSMEE